LNGAIRLQNVECRIQKIDEIVVTWTSNKASGNDRWRIFKPQGLHLIAVRRDKPAEETQGFDRRAVAPFVGKTDDG
jgi:hypothetical protein